MDPKDTQCPHVRCIQEVVPESIREKFCHWYRVVDDRVRSNLKIVQWGMHGTKNLLGILRDQKLAYATFGHDDNVTYLAKKYNFELAVRFGDAGLV